MMKRWQRGGDGWRWRGRRCRAVATVAGVLAAWIVIVGCGGDGGRAEPELLVHAAASLREPVALAGERFASEPGGCRVVLQSGGSQTLLGSVEVSDRGDVFVPADASYLAMAAERGRIGAQADLARMAAVVLVDPGFLEGREIAGWRDLLRSDARIVLADPATAAVGRMVRERFEALGLWEETIARVRAFKSTVTDAANDVELGSADATIVWEPVARQHPGLAVLVLPELGRIQARVAAGVLSSSREPELALAFVRFLASGAGGDLWAREGYLPPEAGTLAPPDR